MNDVILGALIGVGATLIGVFFAYKLQAGKEEKERKQQLESILDIINRELIVEKSVWERKPTVSRYKKLEGYDLLLDRELQDMLSINLVRDLKSAYFNLNRIYMAMDKIDEEYLKRSFQPNEDNSAEQKRNSLINLLVSNHQNIAMQTIDECILQIKRESELRGWKIKSG
jgi:hypothetical protein